MHTLRDIAVVMVALLVLFLGSCAKDSGPVVIRPQVDTLSFRDTILPILVEKCVVCHPGNANLNLSEINAYAQLINVAAVNYTPYLRVSPSDPDGSVLYQKVAGNSEFGPLMPLGAPQLTTDEVGLIYDWIAQGALDN